MTFDIRAACIAAKKRLTRQLNKAVREQKQAIAADFERARKPRVDHVAGATQHRLALVDSGRRMFAACAGSSCDPVRGECLGHCVGAVK